MTERKAELLTMGYGGIYSTPVVVVAETARRYRIRADEVDVAGTRRAVYEVNVATGLTNETVYYLQRRPRIAVRRVSQDGSRVEELTLLETR